MSTPKLPKPFVPTSPEQLQVYDLFTKLPYNEQAAVFRKLSILFDQIMEVQTYEQHREKINAIVIDEVMDDVYKLTNVHGHTYYAQSDNDDYIFWLASDGSIIHRIHGSLTDVCNRIANL